MYGFERPDAPSGTEWWQRHKVFGNRKRTFQPSCPACFNCYRCILNNALSVQLTERDTLGAVGSAGWSRGTLLTQRRPERECADHSPSPESLQDESCPHQTPTDTWRRLSHVACKAWSWAAWTASLPERKGVPTKAPTAAINLLCYSLYTCYSKMGLVKY